MAASQPGRRVRKKRRGATEKKRCARCLELKPLSSFGKNPRMRSGRKSYCRPCSAELQREWNRAQREAEEAEKAKRRRRRSA